MSGVLDPKIAENLAIMMNKLSEDKLPEYDSSQLSSIQRDIVTSSDSKILVVAGAGSGKTRVLTERVKYLIIDKQVDPSNIVAITFTNMAADEMRERLAKISNIGNAFIGTIHSFANKIFKSSGSDYQIYNDYLDNKFYKYLIESYCKVLTFNDYINYKELKFKVEQGRASEADLSDYFTPKQRYEFDMISESYPTADYPETIKSLMKKNNVITFDQLLKEATRYFKSLNSSVEYLLVDELQDIGHLEYKFLKELNAKNEFYVGDDWQAIYSFKGGNVNIFKNLVDDSKYTKYYLIDNYRSSKEVIRVANQVISQVPDRILKEVKIHSSEYGSVIEDNKYSITEYLLNIKSDNNYKNWFILVRTNKDLMDLYNRCLSIRLPVSTFKKGGGR